MFTMTEALIISMAVPGIPEQGKAYFADFKPEAKDEAIANSLFLTWHHFVSLVNCGKADDALLNSTFYFSCRQTRSGRMMRAVKASKSQGLACSCEQDRRSYRHRYRLGSVCRHPDHGPGHRRLSGRYPSLARFAD